MFIEVIHNMAVISFAAIGVYYVFVRQDAADSMQSRLLLGLVFFFVAFTVTITPVSRPGGATIDGRAGPVILAGLIGGPISGFIAAAGGVLARAAVGGPFAFSGVVVFFFYAAAGSLIWLFDTSSDKSPVRPRSIALGILLSLVAAALMYFFIPDRAVAADWMQRDFPFIAAANVLSVGVSAIVVAVAYSVARVTHDLRETLGVLELAKKAGNFGIWQWDPKSETVTWDERNLELHDVADRQMNVTYEDWARSVHPDDIDRADAAFHEMMTNGTRFDAEYRVVLRNGDIRHLKGDAVPVRDASGAITQVVGVNFDLTPLRHSEQELISAQEVAEQAQRLDTIGKMTGGVAHDFNNLLAVVHGNLELLLEGQHNDDLSPAEMRELITSAISAARRGAELTRSMLAFARRSELRPERLELNRVVDETGRWMRRTILERITIDTKLQDDCWDIEVDHAGLQSALVNVIVNARDAMPDGGTLTIETANATVSANGSGITAPDMAPGRYVVVTISDSGEGIPAHILPNIFDPFFTTKEVGVGTGLGLSMVQGFVKQSGGYIRVRTSPTDGTSFALHFPALDTDAVTAVPSPKPTAPAQKPATGARILLVEDQIEVLAMLVRMLERDGFQVETAHNGDTALELYRDDPTFDALITDIVMPGTLQGPALVSEIRKLTPDLPVILVSGYASEDKLSGNGLRPEDIRLLKPISRVELRDALARLMSQINQGDRPRHAFDPRTDAR